MKITQVRNATQIIEYAGKKFLIDPVLAAKGAYPGFAGTARPHLRNPMVDLPMSVEALMNVDAIIVTHTHSDHWDDAAAKLIPKDTIIFVQNESDEKLLRSQGFTNLTILSDNSKFNEISLIKTVCQHGSDEAYADPPLAELLGEASGVVFKHASEKTLYLPGDTIWTKDIAETMRKYQPGVVVMNTGYAQVLKYGAIIFGKEDVLRAHLIVPEAKIVATHMEAINHCLLTRQELMDYVKDLEFDSFVSAPQDGETVAIACH